MHDNGEANCFVVSVKQLISVLNESLSVLSGPMYLAQECIADTLHANGLIFTCGNGGSATDAIHLAEELIGKFEKRRRPLRAVCLNSDVGAITCIANDFGFSEIFARQLQGLGVKGDVLVVFTTSGNSQNCIRAVQEATRIGIKSILVSGKDGGQLAGQCDHELIVPSESTARIQEVHTLILHSWLVYIDSQEWGD